jgi:hypothetical protein
LAVILGWLDEHHSIIDVQRDLHSSRSWQDRLNDVPIKKWTIKKWTREHVPTCGQGKKTSMALNARWRGIQFVGRSRKEDSVLKIRRRKMFVSFSSSFISYILPIIALGLNGSKISSIGVIKD